jgi:repressor LexA
MERKREIYNFIRREISQRGRPPTIREIGARFNISSTNGVRYFLGKLEAEGLINRAGRTARGIRLVGGEHDHSARSIPILGRVPAGGPDFREEHLDGSILVDEQIALGENLFAVRVHGDSMTGAGIHDGDIAIVRTDPTPSSGEIVVALIDEEVTLKRFIKKNGRIILRPENENYRDIVLTENEGRSVSIIGTLEAIVRNY